VIFNDKITTMFIDLLVLDRFRTNNIKSDLLFAIVFCRVSLKSNTSESYYL
jgi:hypothetical protein